MITEQVSQFFADMRERHAIYLRRKAGQPWPWTKDPVMLEYSITNPFRENDKTTRWLRDNVREPLRADPNVLLAIVMFRWFNRITTGEAIFSQTSINEDDWEPPWNKTAWERFLKSGNTAYLKDAILAFCGKGPYVTGSYIIQGWRGMNKLDGVLKCVEEFNSKRFDAVQLAIPIPDRTDFETLHWKYLAQKLLENPGLFSLESVWRWLRQIPYLGDFMAHEIVQDLRYTDLLCDAPDIMTWSNPGPGAERGLARIYGRDITGNIVSKTPKAQLILEMRELLELSRSSEYWPQWRGGIGYLLENVLGSGQSDMIIGAAPNKWPTLELHQIEMWLCEFQKITKARTGEGRPRGKYRHK